MQKKNFAGCSYSTLHSTEGMFTSQKQYGEYMAVEPIISSVVYALFGPHSYHKRSTQEQDDRLS